MNEKEYLAYIEQWKKENKDLIDSGKCRKVFLECLPRGGRNVSSKYINWSSSIDYKVCFIYEDIKGNIAIVNYDDKLTIAYKNNIIKISTSNFKKCRIGKLLNKRIANFKVKIGQIFKDDKRNIKVIDKKYIKDKNGFNKKYYRYECNKCGFDCGKHYSIKNNEHKEELWIREDSLLSGVTCTACCSSPQIIVEGINDIPTTAPWMVEYFQGGYDEAKMYTCNSNKRVYPICPDCGRIKNKAISINDISKRRSIGCSCSDNISFGEKFMFNVLKQLGICFQTQLNKSTFEWIIDDRRYDFYFEYNNKNFIIETHGGQHYINSTRGRSLKEEQENDRIKKELALKNGIKEENYIVVDCRKSELGFIKQNILNSRLNEIFDMSKIDWLKCGEFACNNLVKTVSNLWNSSIKNTLLISNILKINRSTVIDYLKKSNELKWCKYDPKEENIRTSRISGLKHGKSVEIFKDGQSLGTFPSCTDLERQSEKLFKVKLLQGNISLVCNGIKDSYKQFQFKYIENLTEENTQNTI